MAWMAELLGLPPTSAGLLVSGGNMANMVGFWAARTGARRCARSATTVCALSAAQLVAYCSAETHTWIQKAADLSGLGTRAIRWIPVDGDQRMHVAALEAQLAQDRAAGLQPFLVVGTAGTVGTGAVDPLPEIARVCRDARAVVPRRRRVRRAGGHRRRGARRSRGDGGRRLGCLRSAQVALCAARGRVRVRARSRRAESARSAITRPTTTSRAANGIRRPTSTSWARRTRAASAR